MKNPTVRLAIRAILAGLLAFLSQLETHDTWDATVVRSAIVGGVLALAEWLTPLNPSVGPGK